MALLLEPERSSVESVLTARFLLSDSSIHPEQIKGAALQQTMNAFEKKTAVRLNINFIARWEEKTGFLFHADSCERHSFTTETSKIAE